MYSIISLLPFLQAPNTQSSKLLNPFSTKNLSLSSSPDKQALKEDLLKIKLLKKKKKFKLKKKKNLIKKKKKIKKKRN